MSCHMPCFDVSVSATKTRASAKRNQTTAGIDDAETPTKRGKAPAAEDF